MNEQLQNLDTFFELMTMNGVARIYQAARKAGIFSALENPKTLPTLAASLNLMERPLLLLINALEGAGMIKRDGKTFATTPVMKLLDGHYSELGNQYWDHLEDFLHTGIPMTMADNPQVNAAFYQEQVHALDWMMRPSATFAATTLCNDFQGSINVLDLGAGSGVWSRTVLERNVNARAWLFDREPVLEVAARLASRSGTADRTTMVPGDFATLELPDVKFDLIILGNIAHLLSLDELAEAIESLRPHFAERAHVVLFDIATDHPRGGLRPAVYELGLALRTVRGQVHEVADLCELLGTNGFENVQDVPLNITPYTMTMIKGVSR